MKIFQLCILFLSVLVLSGCESKEIPNSYFPSEVGTSWHYKLSVDENGVKNDYNSEVKVKGYEKMKGRQCSVFDYTVNSSSDVFQSEYYFTENGNVNLLKLVNSGREYFFDPPMTILKSNTEEKEWKWSGTGSFGRAVATFRAFDNDTVSAGGEDIKTVRVDSEIITESGLGLKESKWFAANRGLVKSTSLITKDAFDKNPKSVTAVIDTK